MLSLFGSMLVEISLPKLIVAWALLLVLPGLLLGHFAVREGASALPWKQKFCEAAEIAGYPAIMPKELFPRHLRRWGRTYQRTKRAVHELPRATSLSHPV